MDPHPQEAILKAVERHGKENIIVLLGSPGPESAAIAAETVATGDPTYAGPLAGAQLGLTVFHMLEDQVRAALDPQVHEEQVGIMDTVLDKAGIVAALEQVRAANT
jgi:glycine/sarcosine/betaine reductase complex component A